jgi:hypothetical protein
VSYLLDTLFEHGLTHLPADEHAPFAKAFVAALRMQPVCSAEDLMASGYPLPAQYQLRLSVLKPLAYDVLRDRLEMSRATFNRQYDWKAYTVRFGREPSYINTKLKVMVLTYGEWANFVGCNGISFVVPRQAQSLLM